jgi:hypothetical protein
MTIAGVAVIHAVLVAAAQRSAPMRRHRQTKIVATLGPASSDPATTRAALVTR